MTDLMLRCEFTEKLLALAGTPVTVPHTAACSLAAAKLLHMVLHDESFARRVPRDSVVQPEWLYMRAEQLTKMWEEAN